MPAITTPRLETASPAMWMKAARLFRLSPAARVRDSAMAVFMITATAATQIISVPRWVAARPCA